MLVKLTDPLNEFVPDEVTEVDKVGETVDEDENEFDTVCDTERVLQGDAVYETDTVPHGLGDAVVDVVGEMVVLADPQAEPVAVDAYDGVTLDEIVNVAEIVDDEEVDTDPHCEAELDTHDDMVWELECVSETVDDVDIVPDIDCEIELVPHEDAQ